MERNDNLSQLNYRNGSNRQTKKKIAVLENQIESMLDNIMDDENVEYNLDFTDDDDCSSTNSDINTTNKPIQIREEHHNAKTVIVKSSMENKTHKELMNNIAYLEEYQRINKKFPTSSGEGTEYSSSDLLRHYKNQACPSDQNPYLNYNSTKYAYNNSNWNTNINNNISNYLQYPSSALYEVYPETNQHTNYSVFTILSNNKSNQIVLNSNISPEVQALNNITGTRVTSSNYNGIKNMNTIHNNNINNNANSIYNANNYIRNDIYKRTYDSNLRHFINWNHSHSNTQQIQINPLNEKIIQPPIPFLKHYPNYEQTEKTPTIKNNININQPPQNKQTQCFAISGSSEKMKGEIMFNDWSNSLMKAEKIDYLIYNKVKGNFINIIKTHKGCYIFQNYWNQTHNDIIHQLFIEWSPSLSTLMTELYSNCFLKHFFTYLNQKDRIEFLKIIKPSIILLSVHNIGTYPLQAFIEQVGSKKEKNIIISAIKDSVSEWCYNTYGTHVLDKIISCFEDEFTESIYRYIVNNFLSWANNIHGIFIVKRIWTFTHKKELHAQLKEISFANAIELVQQIYGNWVIQVIIESWKESDVFDLLQQFKDNYLKLSVQKYSSNVIERCIEKSSAILGIYIKEICVSGKIIEIMSDSYGNYVLQKALKLSTGENENMWAMEVDKNIKKWNNKKWIWKWTNIVKPHLIRHCIIESTCD